MRWHRDNRWERVGKAYAAMVDGMGETCTCPVEAVEQSYAKGVTDEFILPTVVMEDGQPVGKIQSRRLSDLLQLPPGPRAGDHTGVD